MQILILSGNTGEGHNSAGKALKEYFEARGHSCHMQDGLAFMFRFAGELISHGHVFLYRKMPKVFGMGYRVEEYLSRRQPFQQSLKSRPRRRMRPSSKQMSLKSFLEEGKYDAVISVHVFTAKLLSKLRRREGLNIPCYFVATDYTCSPGVNQLDMDAWFIPHKELIPEFASYGIPEEKIVPSGIPVRSEFFSRQDMADVRRRLHLPEDKKIAVLSCGSMGAGAMGRLAILLAGMLPKNCMLVAICGNNSKLEKKLLRIRKILRFQDRMLVLGFVNRMADYLDAADLFLTKPGGLSTTEAAHKGLPLLLINVAPGCETRNMQFFTRMGCAASAGGALSLASLTASTLRSPEKLHTLQQRCAEEFSFEPREIIFDTISKRVRSE